jgi:Family of unknown function (DUF5522)
MTAAGKQNDYSDGKDDPTRRRDTELREGIDYYVENGLLVFTAAFLRKRGYCCESGCRHCPYQQHKHMDGLATD